MFVMLVGLPGSGKSTIAQKIVETNKEYKCKIFSSDNYRSEILGDINCQTKNDKVFRILYQDMKLWLQNGDDHLAIFDATNISYKDRKRCLDNLRNVNTAKAAYVINTPIEICIEQDKCRDRTVGKYVIDKMVSRFDCPQLFEGFDVIYFLNAESYNEEKDWVEKESLIQHMQNFDQKTPHHKFTLWEHCQNVKNQFELLDIRRVAAIWHDVGKIFTQTIDDKGVAHYYSHEHWSTYYVVSHLYLLGAQTTDAVLQILFFINNHMHIRDIINSEKAIKRYKLLWGEDLYNSLIEFMEADNKGAKERFGNAKNI